MRKKGVTAAGVLPGIHSQVLVFKWYLTQVFYCPQRKKNPVPAILASYICVCMQQFCGFPEDYMTQMQWLSSLVW